MKIGIIREGKIPPDSRVPLTPDHCAEILQKYPVEIVVQKSPARCFSDDKYAAWLIEAKKKFAMEENNSLRKVKKIFNKEKM